MHLCLEINLPPEEYTAVLKTLKDLNKLIYWFIDWF